MKSPIDRVRNAAGSDDDSNGVKIVCLRDHESNHYIIPFEMCRSKELSTVHVSESANWQQEKLVSVFL